MTQIIPAILATDENEYKEKLFKLENSQLKNGWVQIDIMDNKFVQNKSIDISIVDKEVVPFNVEVHLMVEEPHLFLPALDKTQIKRFIAPVEVSEQSLDEFIDVLKAHGKQIGIAINPQTPLQKLERYLKVVDLVLVMGVEPGSQGQKFIDSTVEKIRRLNKLQDHKYDFKIEVDGGITPEIAKQLSEAGVDNLVVGSHLLEGSINENLIKFNQAI